MPGVALEYHYPLFTLLTVFLVLVFVPKQKFAPFVWTSLLWGFFLSIIFPITFGKLFDLFRYVHVYPFTFYGSPLWLNVAWLGAIMLFLRFLPTRKIWYVFPVYLFVFAFASLVLDMPFFHQLRLLIYTGWNPFDRFLAGLCWFYGLWKGPRLESRLMRQDEGSIIFSHFIGINIPQEVIICPLTLCLAFKERMSNFSVGSSWRLRRN